MDVGLPLNDEFVCKVALELCIPKDYAGDCEIKQRDPTWYNVTVILKYILFANIFHLWMKQLKQLNEMQYFMINFFCFFMICKIGLNNIKNFILGRFF